MDGSNRDNRSSAVAEKGHSSEIEHLEAYIDRLQRTVERLRVMNEELQVTNEDLRRLSRGLNPAGLEERNLTSALGQLADAHTEARGDLSCTFTAESKWPAISNDQARHLYWIAREAVANARRHGQPSRIRIRLDRRSDNSLILSVADDGSGFDPPGDHTSDEDSAGMGLRSMRYRMRLLGGDLSIDTAPGQGTTITCIVPPHRLNEGQERTSHE